MKYKIKPSATFKKEVKTAQKRNLDLSLLTKVIDMLADGIPLPAIHRDHNLHGDFKGYRECHIQNDWLLIYKYGSADGTLYLYLARTGTHSDLF